MLLRRIRIHNDVSDDSKEFSNDCHQLSRWAALQLTSRETRARCRHVVERLKNYPAVRVNVLASVKSRGGGHPRRWCEVCLTAPRPHPVMAVPDEKSLPRSPRRRLMYFPRRPWFRRAARPPTDLWDRNGLQISPSQTDKGRQIIGVSVRAPEMVARIPRPLPFKPRSSSGRIEALVIDIRVESNILSEFKSWHEELPRKNYLSVLLKQFKTTHQILRDISRVLYPHMFFEKTRLHLERIGDYRSITRTWRDEVPYVPPLQREDQVARNSPILGRTRASTWRPNEMTRVIQWNDHSERKMSSLTLRFYVLRGSKWKPSNERWRSHVTPKHSTPHRVSARCKLNLSTDP